MSTEANKDVVRRFFDAWNRGDLDEAYALLAPDIVDHAVPPGYPAGLAGVQRSVADIRTAFPHGQFTIEDLIGEGDRVVARWTVRATHEGPLFGIAATGRRVTVTGIDIARVVDGKAVEHWRIFDQLGMLQQLGAIPASGAPPAN